MDIKIEKKKGLFANKRRLYLILGSVFAASSAWLMFHYSSSTLHVEKKGLSLATVARGRFNDYVSVEGTVVPISVVQISPEEGGIVMEKVVEEGAHVQAGDVLVRLSNANLDLQILNAESELAEKQDMLRNTQLSIEQAHLNNSNEELQLAQEVIRQKRNAAQQEALYKERLNAREEYLKAQEDYSLAQKRHALVLKRLQKDTQLRQAQMAQMADNLENMRKNLVLVRQRKDKLNVRSQISGEVGALNVEVGQSIAPGTKIGQINNLSDYKIEAKIDEHYIERIHTGVQATFEQGGKRYLLRVKKIFPEVHEGRFKVELTFTGKHPDKMRAGQTYYLDLQFGESTQAVLIPKGTFYSVTDGKWIFVLDKNGNRAYRRNIRIGRQNPQYYEVIEGLEAGEQVIVSGYEAYANSETLVF